LWGHKWEKEKERAREQEKENERVRDCVERLVVSVINLTVSQILQSLEMTNQVKLKPYKYDGN
jgi:hypothetical protein